MENKPTVWAFGEYKVNEETKELLRKSIWDDKKSRFGWSPDARYDLRKEPTEEHRRQLFLLEIKEGDWIVHINLPEYGQCTAVKVVSEYDFDEEGIPSIHNGQERKDFRHYLGVEPVIEFDRNAVVRTVNLRPRRRYHRIYAVDDFEKSIENLQKGKKVELLEGESQEEYYFKEKIKEEELLSKVSYLLYKTNPSKHLEKFLAKVFRKVPNVENVFENGSGWKSDFGADLIVDMNILLSPEVEIKNTIIVQIKSYGGICDDLGAVDQIKRGIKEFRGTAGIIATTAEGSKNLKDKIEEVSDEIGVPINLLDSEALVKFIIKYAPEMISLNPETEDRSA